MKILQVNCVYKNGSTGKIVYDIHTELKKKGIESIICYGRGKQVLDSGVYKVTSTFEAKLNSLYSRICGIMYGGAFFATSKLISIIKKEKPDVVHLQCVNCYILNIYKIVTFLKKKNIKTVVTLHAEFMYTANCAHAYECEKWKSGCGRCPDLKRKTRSFFLDRTDVSWMKMKRAFDGFQNIDIVSVSPWLKERATESPILADFKHHVIHNGLDPSIFCAREILHLREKHQLHQNEKVIFHVTPSFDNNPFNLKGGIHLIELAKRLIGENVRIIVAGGYPEGLAVPDNITLLGEIKDQQLLAEYYNLADVTVITSKRETFSMVCAESFCCGTPVVGFLSGGPESISLKDYSSFVKYGDIDALETAVRKMIFSSDAMDKQQIIQQARIYSKHQMVNKYIEIYNE